MFPPRTPVHVQNAHTRIIPIYEFLAKYERWIAASGGDYCDFALGNPQTMPLDEFVAALREATTPKDKSWYAYKMNEVSSREIVLCFAEQSHWLRVPAGKHIHDEWRHRCTSRDHECAYRPR
jgi:hypothetical protein